MHLSRHAPCFVALFAASSLTDFAEALAGTHGRIWPTATHGDYVASVSSDASYVGSTHPLSFEAARVDARGDLAFSISATGANEMEVTSKVSAAPPPLVPQRIFSGLPQNTLGATSSARASQTELEQLRLSEFLTRMDEETRRAPGGVSPQQVKSAPPSAASGVGLPLQPAQKLDEHTAPALLAVGKGKVSVRDPDELDTSKRGVLSFFIFASVCALLFVRTMIFKGHPEEVTRVELPDIEPTKEEEKDPDAYAQQFAPVGNIFRHLARDTEWRKHQEDLHAQLVTISTRHCALLDRLPDEYPDIDDVEEKRCHKLVDLLRAAAEQQGPNGKHLDACISILGEAAPIRIFFKLILVPSDLNVRQRFYKDRFVALIITLIMTVGPALIISSMWDSEDNVINQSPSSAFSLAAVTSCGASEAIGTLLIILIFEFGRTYVVNECIAFDQMKTLPADKMWSRLGQFTNMICVLTTMLAMPVIFLCEPYPKDMVFDSMAMLFIFTLDDLGNDVLAYLNMDDASFRSSYVQMVRELQQVPVRLDDFVNKSASEGSQIWNITKFDEVSSGVTSERRLYLDRQPGGSQLIYSATLSKSHTMLMAGAINKLIRVLWLALYYILTIGEIVVPICFMSIT